MLKYVKLITVKEVYKLNRSVKFIAFILVIITLFGTAVFGADAKSSAKESASDKPENAKVVFLLYHDLVADKLTKSNNPEYCTTGEKFRADLMSLLDAGWKSISCEMYYNNEYEEGGKYFVVTFDDGYLSNYTVAYPILCELKVYGDIFMCTENTGLTNHFKWRQGDEMEKSGFVKLYSHTTKHKDLKSSDALTFCKNAARSFCQLGIKLKEQKRELFFSYPGSDYSRETVENLYKDGVKLQFVQIMPGKDAGWDWKSLGLTQRISIGYKTDVPSLIKEIFGWDIKKA